MTGPNFSSIHRSGMMMRQIEGWGESCPAEEHNNEWTSSCLSKELLVKAWFHWVFYNEHLLAPPFLLGCKCSMIFTVHKYSSTFCLLRPYGQNIDTLCKGIEVPSREKRWKLKLMIVNSCEIFTPLNMGKKPPHNRNRKINSANYVHLMFKLMSCIDDEAAETRWQWKL